MGRGTTQKNEAQNVYNEQQGVFNKAWGNQNQLFGQLFPEYSAEAAGQDTPGSIAENTAAQDSSGGALSSLLGHLGLQAARTRNAAGSTAAADEGVRSAMRTNADTAARIKAGNVAKGQAGLNSLYGSNVSQGENALGGSNEAINTYENVQ